MIGNSQIQNISAMDKGKGLVFNVWNLEKMEHPALIYIPFKQILRSAKKGWNPAMKPGCDEDLIHVVTKYNGTKNIPNKLGQLVQVVILEAVAVFDGWEFYRKK